MTINGRLLYTEGHTDHEQQNTSGVYVRLCKIVDIGVYTLEIHQFYKGKDMGRKIEAIDAYKYDEPAMIREAIARYDCWSMAMHEDTCKDISPQQMHHMIMEHNESKEGYNFLRL